MIGLGILLVVITYLFFNSNSELLSQLPFLPTVTAD
jgi:hypothetical protein